MLWARIPLKLFLILYVLSCISFLDLASGGIGNEEKINPSSGKLGFSSGQFQIFYFKRSHKNNSFIFIPSAAVDQRGKFRLTDKFIIYVKKRHTP